MKVDERTSRLLRARLAREQAVQRLPSVAAGLAREGELVWSCGVGPVTPGTTGAEGEPQVDEDTQYRCGSITKTFVAVEVMRLREEGRLRLSDPIGTHLDAGQASSVTISQLLSHAAGLRAESDGPWWERTAGASFDELREGSLGADAFRWPSGWMLHYSNVGYALLGQLVSRLTGRGWFEAISDDLLQPLGMGRTTLRPVAPCTSGWAVHPFADVLLPEPEHDAGAMAPAGQIWTNIADLARWSGFLAGACTSAVHRESGDAPTGAVPLLGGSSLEEMREPRGVFDERHGSWATSYGLGLQLWNENGRKSYGHTGSMPGFVAVVKIDAETSDAVVVLANSTSGFGGELPNDLLDILGDNEPRMAPLWRPEPVDGEMLELVGLWHWGPRPVLVRLAAGELEIEPVGGKGRASRFSPIEDGRYVGRDGYYAGEHLHVVRNPDGSVRQLDLASFIFTRTPYDPAADVPGGVDSAGWHAPES